MKEPKVITVIATLGENKEILISAINSIWKFSNYKNMTLIVVDNSIEGNLQLDVEVSEIIHPGINLGWVGALEFVRRNYDFDYLWTFQDDMTALNDVLTILVQEMESDRSLGVVSPVALINGLIPARSRGGILSGTSWTEWEHIPEIDTSPSDFIDYPNLCYVASSGALWRKRSLDEISGFDLNFYPAIYVDFDTCFRFISKKWGLKIIPSAHVSHHRNGSLNSILANTLYHLNGSLFRSKNIDAAPAIHKPVNILDLEFLYLISKKASFLFLHIAKASQNEINRLRDEKKELIETLEMEKQAKTLLNSQFEALIGSRSWHLTKPFRIILKSILRLNKKIRRRFLR